MRNEDLLRKLALLFIIYVVFVVTVLVVSGVAKASTVYVNSINGLRVRSEPNKNGSVVRVIPYADPVEVEQESGKWLKVDDGYIKAKHTQTENPLDELEFLGEWRVTAYAETGYNCANGKYPSRNYTIAHNSLPFDTKVYIEGVGVRTVEDRGPTYLGNEWCDLYLGDVSTCIQWGDQRRKVWLVE